MLNPFDLFFFSVKFEFQNIGIWFSRFAAAIPLDDGFFFCRAFRFFTLQDAVQCLHGWSNTRRCQTTSTGRISWSESSTKLIYENLI